MPTPFFAEKDMRIIPERVTVIPDAHRNELTVIMEGFRLTLPAEEARALSYALVQGMKQLMESSLARRLGTGPSKTNIQESLPAHQAQEPPEPRAADGAMRSMSG